jgi:hypothetical protein
MAGEFKSLLCSVLLRQGGEICKRHYLKSSNIPRHVCGYCREYARAKPAALRRNVGA